MLDRLAHVIAVRRRLVLVVTFVGLVLAGVVGAPVAGLLNHGGFDDPKAEAIRADAYLREELGSGRPDVVVLVNAGAPVTPGTLPVDDPAVVAAAERYTARLVSDPRLTGVTTYWSVGRAAPLRSTDGTSALVVAQLVGNPDDLTQLTKDVEPLLRTADGPISVRLGGFGPTFLQVDSTIKTDLLRAEAIAVPVTAVLLVLVFGSVVAALMPLVVGILSIFGSLVVLRLLVEVTDVSVFALNLTTALGLGLGIDYALFLVARYREEVRGGAQPTPALATTLRTAGRTVLFSALTVAVSLSALLVFPQYFLRSFAYAGIAVVTFAALAALVVLPAMLAVAGRRIDALDVRKPLGRVLGRTVGRIMPARPARREGFWLRVSTLVMRRPLPVATAAVGLLLLLAAPFLGARFGLPDDRVLPAQAEAAQVGEVLRTSYLPGETRSLDVVLPGTTDRSVLPAYAAALSQVPGVARVEAATGVYVGGTSVLGPNPVLDRYMDAGPAPAGTWLRLIPTVEAYSAEGAQLTADVRAVPAPGPVLVGGTAAEFVDARASVADRLPLALGLIAAVTFVLLFLMTGSVILPIKAVVLNLLSLAATLGAMVWVFQDGNGAGLLDFTATGLLDLTTPLLMFALIFGLSMDYEVFVLSRIKEEHDRGRAHRDAIAVGLQRTGSLISSAAALLAIVFLATAWSGITFIKLLGIGMALAVLLDATVVRATLMPATMRLLGPAAWWAPAALRRVHARFGLSEGESATPADPEPASVPADRDKVLV